MNWIDFLNLAVLLFMIHSMFDMRKHQLEHHIGMISKLRETWVAISEVRGHIAGLHDKYAKLYTRVTDLEKANEVHSRNSG